MGKKGVSPVRSEADAAKWREAIDGGHNDVELAALFGCTVPTAMRWRKKLAEGSAIRDDRGRPKKETGFPEGRPALLDNSPHPAKPDCEKPHSTTA